MKPKRRKQQEECAQRAAYALIDIRAVQITIPDRGEEDGQEEIAYLASSIARHGLLQPILVRKSPQPGQYILICGARRLRACRMAGVAQVHAMVLEGDEQEAVACWLEGHWTQKSPSLLTETRILCRSGEERIRQRFSLPQALLDARLRIVALPVSVQELIQRYNLTLEQAEPLLEIKDEPKQVEAAELIGQRELNARQARRLISVPRAEPCYSGRRRGLNAAMAVIHEAVRRLQASGFEAQVGMHSQEDGVRIQIYLKNVRLFRR